MRKLVLSTFVMALALLACAYLAAAAEIKTTTKLTGAAEVPGPGDTKGSGTAEGTLNPDKNEVCYDLSVKDIQEATAALIQEGAAGKSGPPKVQLHQPKTASAKG